MIVFVDFLNSMSENQRNVWVLYSARCEIDTNFWKEKIASPLEALSTLRRESFLRHRQQKQTSKESAAPVQTGR